MLLALSDSVIDVGVEVCKLAVHELERVVKCLVERKEANIEECMDAFTKKQ